MLTILNEHDLLGDGVLIEIEKVAVSDKFPSGFALVVTITGDHRKFHEVFCTDAHNLIQTANKGLDFLKEYYKEDK